MARPRKLAAKRFALPANRPMLESVTRVLLIGARCRRQGIGEHVARWFAHAGATVCAVVGTSPETSAAAAATLLERYGIDCRAYSSVEQALERETPDVVAVCSPYQYHREHLELSRAAGVHCLCEKPLWWEDHPQRVAATERLAEGFARQGKLLATVTQWPFTLAAFFELHPAVREECLKSLSMELAPSRSGRNMVLDAAPHVLSLLEALVGDGDVIAPTARWQGERHLTLEFRWGMGVDRPPVQVSLVLTTCERPPRPAGYTINGRKARREIVLPQYDMLFTDAGRQVPVEDPLKLLVRDFLGQIELGTQTNAAPLACSIRALELLCAAAA